MNSNERHELRYQRRKVKRLEKKLGKYGDCDDFIKIFTYEHLWEASKKCIKNVRWKASVQKFIANRPLYLAIIKRELLEGKLRIKDCFEFYIYERGKKRHIRSVGIKERVIQRCLCDYSLTPMLSKTFIYDNGASMKGKGVSFTRKRIKKHVKSFIRKYKEGYVLVFDFKKYFDSIPHELILNILHKNYTDERIIDLIMKFVKFSNKDKGLDLGSQISQILALAAANPIDHFIKDTLGMKYYNRYMDDGCLFHQSKEWLNTCKEMISKYAASLGLTLNLKKTRIVKLTKGFTFLKNKYRIVHNNRLLIVPTKDSTTRMRRKLKKFAVKLKRNEMTYDDVLQSFKSWTGHLKGTKCYKTVYSMEKLFDKLFIEPFTYDYDRHVSV